MNHFQTPSVELQEMLLKSIAAMEHLMSLFHQENKKAAGQASKVAKIDPERSPSTASYYRGVELGYEKAMQYVQHELLKLQLPPDPAHKGASIEITTRPDLEVEYANYHSPSHACGGEHGCDGCHDDWDCTGYENRLELSYRVSLGEHNGGVVINLEILQLSGDIVLEFNCDRKDPEYVKIPGKSLNLELESNNIEFRTGRENCPEICANLQTLKATLLI